MAEITLRDGEFGPLLDNGDVRVSVNLKRGTFSIETARASLLDAGVAVEVDDRTYSTRGDGWSVEEAERTEGRTTLLLTRDSPDDEPAIRAAISVDHDRPWVTVQAHISSPSSVPVRVGAFRVLDRGCLDISAPADTLRFYKHGWQSWSPTLVLDCAGEDLDVGPPVLAPRTQPEHREGRFVSEMMTVVATPDGQGGVLAGFVTTADQFSQVWFDGDGRQLTAVSYADGVTLEPGRRLSSEVLLIDAGGTALEALSRYGAELAERMGAIPVERVASGWCSWYHYFTRVTEADIVANLKDLAKHKDSLPIDYIQIDDGYQADIGDWLEMNEKFPRGMRWLVDRIHAAGYKAGLWLAPFLMGANSRLYADHPEWAVQHTPGKPSIANINWGQACFALDLSRPDVIEWLGNVFRTVTEGWGVDYVKIDFIYAGAVDGIRHDPNVTRAQAYRRGLQAIRDAVGDRFILGCGNPLAPSIGLVDGSRIGPDVAPYWHPYEFEPMRARSTFSEPATVNGIRNALTRYWMHGRLWQNDPDCLMVRATDTALSGDEVRCLATVIGLTGGMVLDSDDMTLLDDERRDVISMLLPTFGKSGIPEDLFASPMPERLVLDCESHQLIATFNWEDSLGSRSIALPGTPSHVFDVWSRTYLGVHPGSIELEVPPHGCRLLAVRRNRDVPQVVGTSLHLLQGALECAGEDWDGESLTVNLLPVARKRGELFLCAPAERGTPVSPGLQIMRREDGTYGIPIEVREPQRLVIRFET